MSERRKNTTPAKPAKLALHADIDAFFASVEQLLSPALRRRPVIVGSGVIASCSYEARRFGLRAGMPLGRAKRLCPHVVILAGDHAIYRCFAETVWEVCRRFTCGLQTYLDDAYGDAGGMERIYGPPRALGERLRREALAETGLSISVGLAANCMMAKIASSSAKPAGVAWIEPGRQERFLTALPIEKLPGVGPKTAPKLRDMGIETVGQLRRLPRALLKSMFGLRGELLYERCRGRDSQIIRPAAMPRTISRETTFSAAASDPHEIRGMLFYLLERAVRATRKQRLLARQIKLSIRYNDFKQLAASRTLPTPTADEDEIFPLIVELLGRLHRRRVALRGVGIVLSGFVWQAGQAELFCPPPRVRRRELHSAVDAIRDRWGHAAVVTGESIGLLGKLAQNDYGFILRTPSLTK